MGKLTDCPNCGGKISPDDQFCGSCGAEVIPVKPAVQAPPSECPKCGKPLSADDQFCGACGHRISGSQPAKETPVSESSGKKQPKSKKLGWIIIVIVGLMAVGLYILNQGSLIPLTQQPPGQGRQPVPSDEEITEIDNLMDEEETDYRNDSFENFQQPAGRDGRLVPSDEEIAELESLMMEAETEWLEAEIAGDNQITAEKAQEFAHYKTGFSHVLNMKIAFEEMLEAEEAGDMAMAQSKRHSISHYKGQLTIMRQHAKRLPAYLDQKIQEWTEP
jgi:hypothetical protein